MYQCSACLYLLSYKRYVFLLVVHRKREVGQVQSVLSSVQMVRHHLQHKNTSDNAKFCIRLLAREINAVFTFNSVGIVKLIIIKWS